MEYTRMLKNALNESKLLELNPRIFIEEKLSSMEKLKINNLCENDLLNHLVYNYSNYDWSIICWNIALESFKLLQHFGIKSEIVIGEVNINGTDEYDTNLESLKNELLKGASQDTIPIHLWVQVADNYIIDATMSAKLKKYYIKDYPFPSIVHGSANELYNKLRLQYKPMLVGAKFIEKTCNYKMSYNEKLY